ncbi:unnamed protein product [Brachionus calyciflorus]|uniref:Uncharacterized protein n=1 Tax=Brachionus calyciflorus TaxID=104777 RepID=A0A814EYM2_9BILA|nr:unnamed protein product [Brachionus calyciflorus]
MLSKYKKIYLLNLIICSIVVVKFSNLFNKKENISKNVLVSDCKCKSNEYVELGPKKNGSYLVRFNNKSYQIDPTEQVFTCDLYNSLRRGPNQKVISYSLFGKNTKYYKLIYETANKIEKIYPDHIIRIYHNESLDKTFICDLECSKRHLDFCNIKKLPLDIYNKINYRKN